MQLIRAFVQSLYFLNWRLQASNNFLWLYSQVVLNLVGNPKYKFSRDTAQIGQSLLICIVNFIQVLYTVWTLWTVVIKFDTPL